MGNSSSPDTSVRLHGAGNANKMRFRMRETVYEPRGRSMSNWYVIQHGNRLGPFSPAQLKQMAAAGNIQAQDQVQKDDGEPQLASSVRGLVLATPTPSNVPTPVEPPPVPPPVQEPPPLVGNSHPGNSSPGEHADGHRGFEPPRVREGIDLAKSAFKKGTTRLRTSFGSASADTIRLGKLAMADLFSHPVKLTFAYVVLNIACLFASVGLVTILLIPVFVLGYIRYTKAVIEDEEPTFGEFIAFMRHGWDSLWHLLMLLAAFFVTVALMIAPVVLAVVLVVFCFGTIGSGIAQLSDLGSSEDSHQSEHGSSGFSPNWGGRESRSGSRDGLIASFVDAVSALGTFVVRIVLFVIMFLVVNAVLAPVSAAMILVFTLALGLSENEPESEARFDLVYNSFSRMLIIARTHWKRLLCGGLFLSTLLTLTFVAAMLAAGVCHEIGLRYFGLWLVNTVLPVASFLFVIYVSVYCVRTSLALRQDSA